jgi:hypothetical protein
MIFLVDHNLEGHALLLSGSLTNQGWAELFSIGFVLLEEIDLSVGSSDRVVWRFAQAKQMILLTANRRMKGKDSLERRFSNGRGNPPVVAPSGFGGRHGGTTPTENPHVGDY